MVAAELAMAVVLVVGAGLMIKGNYRAARVERVRG